MNISSVRAYHGLQATAEPTSEGTSGSVTIGQGQTVASLSSVTSGIVLGIELDSTYDVELDLATLTATPTGTGVNQVETATAAGTITASGNATVIVTGDDITGSPLTVSVAVANTDTAATWAAKVRAELNATAVITQLYTVGGSTTSITLTRVDKRYNDPTLNISLANGTCTGITTAATSTNTTAGVNPAKCWRIPGFGYDSDNFEGSQVAAITGYYGYHIRHTAGSGGIEITKSDSSLADIIGANEFILKGASGLLPSFSLSPSSFMTFTGATGYSKAILTLMFD